MCHVTTEVLLHDALPGEVVLLAKFLHMGHCVLLYGIYLQHLSSTFHGVLLCLLPHISIPIDHTVDQGLGDHNGLLAEGLLRLGPSGGWCSSFSSFK